MAVSLKASKNKDRKGNSNGRSLGMEIVDRAGIEKAFEGEKKSMISTIPHKSNDDNAD